MHDSGLFPLRAQCCQTPRATGDPEEQENRKEVSTKSLDSVHLGF